MGYFKCREVKTGFYRNKSMQTGSSGTLIGWKSGQTTFVPLWDRMDGAWLWTQERVQDEKKQEWQKSPAGTRQTEGKNLVWFGEIERKLAKLSKTTFAYRSSS
jgi:hypothetical protein